jgi:hypothetical protein
MSAGTEASPPANGEVAGTAPLSDDPAEDPAESGRPDPQPGMDVEPVGGGAPPPMVHEPEVQEMAADPELLRQVNAEIQQVTKRSWAELLILVLGAMFLLGAVGLIVFLVM